MTKLSDIAAINPSRKVKKGDSVPFIEMAALPVSGRDISPSAVATRIAKSAGAHFQNGDTLLARITPCLENGKTAQVNALPEGAIGEGSTEFIVLCGHDRADNDFVYYLCRDPRFRDFAISRMEGTSGRQRVAWQSIASYEFDLPQPKIRRTAAKILATIDDRIDNLHQTNTTLEAIAAALFKSRFVDFDGVPPEEMQESELGLIPKGWRVTSLSDVLEIIGGGTPKTGVSEYWNGDIPWFSVADTPMASDVFVITTEKNITQTGLDQSSVRLIPKGTTIISARGTVGNLAIAGCDMTFNQSCYGLRGKNGAGDYFVFLIAQRIVKKLKSMAHGSVFSTITRQTFGMIRVAVPPEEFFREFEQTVSVLFEKILSNVQRTPCSPN